MFVRLRCVFIDCPLCAYLSWVVRDGLGAGENRREIIQGWRRAFGHAAVRKHAAMHGMQRGNGEKQAQTNHENKSAVVPVLARTRMHSCILGACAGTHKGTHDTVRART